MKVAVLGANGMLGSMLVDYLSQYFTVLGTKRRNLNALRPDFRMLEDCDWVINAIGVIPQRCQDRDLLFKVNGLFPWELAKTGKKIIHITTDCIYSGTRGNYLESDMSDCEEEYGRSKWAGEVLDYPDFHNLRCSIVGLEPEGNYSLLKKYVSCRDKEFPGYTNHFWNGITTLAFAKICKGIIENDITLPQVQNIVPADWVTKFNLLIMAQKHFKVNTWVIPVNSFARIDRRLNTIRPDVNLNLWNAAGYKVPPKIEDMVRELAEYKAKVLV